MLQLEVVARAEAAEGIVRIALASAAGAALPAFTAGAHIDLHLPNGLVRSYSLLEADRDMYAIAVACDRASRGGSSWIHEHLQPGVRIGSSAPRNNFPLAEAAERSLFIAGGIGITPIMSMLARLEALRRDWRLVYCARSRRAAAFADDLARYGDRVRLHLDDEAGGGFADIGALVTRAQPQTHFYCCGPLPMLAAFEAATQALDPAQVHVEYFSARAPRSTAGGYTVVLARSGRELEVRAGHTIIDTMMMAGIDTPYSCLEGVCGTCETRVLEGEPDHRDLVLSRAERDSNRTMIICCSGSKSARLVLDL